MISIRTFFKTTMFWALIMIVFRGYTQLIDDTPAKELLHTIGRSELGNLTITNTTVYSIDDNADIYKRLDRLEQKIETNTLLITNKPHNLTQIETMNPSYTIPNDLNTENQTASPMTDYSIIIPVFDSNNARRAEDGVLRESTYGTIQRSIPTANLQIDKLYTLLTSTQLSHTEIEQGLNNIFFNSKLQLETFNVNNKALTLTFSGRDTVSDTQREVMQGILERFYTQFDEIDSLFITTT